MKAFLVMIVVAALGGGGTLLLRDYVGPAEGADAIQSNMLFTARRGGLNVTITENGSLMAKNSEKITVRSRRGGKITFLVEEGKQVEQDEVLCRMDTTDLESRQQQLELDIVKTEADLDTAKTELDIQKSENVASIEKAEIALTKAKMELERYEQGDYPKEARTLEVAIKEAENEFAQAKKNYEDSLVLFEKEYINASQVDQDRIKFERADIQLEGAKRDLVIFNEYQHPITQTDKKTAVSDAQRSLDNAEKRAKSTLRQKEVGVESNERRLTRLKKQLEEVKEEIGNFTISSSAPGIVIYGDPQQYWTRGEIKLGGQVWGGFTLFTIPDLRVMKVQIEVHEADINKVAVDQVATVTMDTYPGLVLSGKVTKVASIAGGGGGRPGRDEVKKFTVDIILGETDELTLKPGISAKAEIFVEERADVLQVPIQCVFVEEGTHFCYVLHDGAPSKVAVEVGTSNDTYIELIGGVEEGANVLLYNPTIQGDPAAADPARPEPAAEPGPVEPDPSAAAGVAGG